MEIRGSSKYLCFKGKKDISEKVAKLCFRNRPKLGGKAIALTVKDLLNTRSKMILGRVEDILRFLKNLFRNLGIIKDDKGRCPLEVMTSTRGGGMKTVNRSKRIEMGTT